MTSADITPLDGSGKKVSPQAYVYVIAAEGEAVKIGVAKNIQRRLNALQIGHPRRLSVAHEFMCVDRVEAYAVESRSHRLLKQHHMSGEWFGVSPEAAKAAADKAFTNLKEEHLQEKE